MGWAEWTNHADLAVFIRADDVAEKVASLNLLSRVILFKAGRRGVVWVERVSEGRRGGRWDGGSDQRDSPVPLRESHHRTYPILETMADA